MKKIELFEKAIYENAGNLKDYGINANLLWAYRKSKDAENELIDLYEVIWEEDIEPIASFLRENGVTEFTISSTFSGLIPTLEAFEKLGVHIAGVTEVNATWHDFITGERARIPALRMIVE